MLGENQDKYYTELDKDLQNLATMDWPTFVHIVGEDEILAAKICLLKTRGLTQQQISIKLGITLKKSRVHCEKCQMKITKGTPYYGAVST